VAAHAGEMRVNNGGDPGRDDYGLPPVDIEVPDDARELDSDVQAYRRELRAQRRRMLAQRLYGPLTRDGMVLPLLAGCLALTLLAATLLTVFTVGQGASGRSLAGPGAVRQGAPRAGTGRLATQRPTAAPVTTGRPGEPLPDAVLVSSGIPEHLRDLIGPVLVLALIPPKCQCFSDLRQLTGQADRGGAVIYLVGTEGANVDGLPRRLELGATQALDDSDDTLPPNYQRRRLTAILVSKNGSVAGIVPDRHGFQIVKAVRALTSVQATGSPSPAPSVSPSPSPASSPVVMAPSPAG
jgi:hypothetical protein